MDGVRKKNFWEGGIASKLGAWGPSLTAHTSMPQRLFGMRDVYHIEIKVTKVNRVLEKVRACTILKY